MDARSATQCQKLPFKPSLCKFTNRSNTINFIYGLQQHKENHLQEPTPGAQQVL